jgi:hypothetical protein
MAVALWQAQYNTVAHKRIAPTWFYSQDGNLSGERCRVVHTNNEFFRNLIIGSFTGTEYATQGTGSGSARRIEQLFTKIATYDSCLFKNSDTTLVLFP